MIKTYSRVLRVCKPETQLGKNLKILQKRKLKVLRVKSTPLRMTSPAFLALELAQDGYLSDVRWPG